MTTSKRAPVAVFALALLVAGCGATRTSAPVGDTSGEHLVVFNSDRGNPGHFALYLWDLDQAGFHALRGIGATTPEGEPCLSGDGRFVAYTAPGAAAGDTEVVIYDRLDERVLDVAELKSGHVERRPRFTGDGLRLAFERDTLGAARVRLYESTSHRYVLLPGLDAAGTNDDGQPSPDVNGDVIAFTSDRSGKPHVYVWDRALAGLRSLAALIGDGDDVEPSLSPDGRWLAFSTSRTGGAGGWDVALYDLTSGAYVPLPNLNSADDERHPSVSRDGSVIAFASNRPTTGGGASELYFYFRSDSTVRVSSGLPSAGDDRQPFLRWR